MKNGHELGNALEEDSGGIVDLCGFALRLSCLLLQKPQARKLLVLDEPFKFVSVEYRDKLCAMLENLSKEFKVQIIMITHVKEMLVGRIIRL